MTVVGRFKKLWSYLVGPPMVWVAPFLIWLLRLALSFAVVVALPIVLVIPNWSSIHQWQWMPMLVIVVIFVVHKGFEYWPRFQTIRAMRDFNRQRYKLELLLEMLEQTCWQYIRIYQSTHTPKSNNSPTEMRVALLVIVRCRGGFSRRLITATATGSLADAEAINILWRKKEGFCGECWDAGWPRWWEQKERPANWDKMGKAQQAVRNDRSGVCVPILGTKAKVQGIIYLDFDRSVTDTGLHTQQGAGTLMKIAGRLFASEIPDKCVVGRA